MDLVMVDLYCCEGGAARGYLRHFERVIGADTDKACRLHYPGEFHHMSALDALDKFGDVADAAHASPPCQRHTQGNAANDTSEYADWIAETRKALISWGKPWVMENVVGAPLREDLRLCGSMFGLRAEDEDGTPLQLRRHRIFESNIVLMSPGPCQHVKGMAYGGAYGGARRNREEAKQIRKGGYVPSAEVQARLLGVEGEGMTQKGMRECIPPAYTDWLGWQLAAAIPTVEAKPAA